MDLGGRETVPVDAVARAGVGPARSDIPLTAMVSPSAFFPPEVSDVSGLGGGDGDAPPSHLPRDGTAGQSHEEADDWLLSLLNSDYDAPVGGPHPPPPLPPLSPLPPPPPQPPLAHPPMHLSMALRAAKDGDGGGGRGKGPAPPPFAAALTAMMPVDGETAVDAAMAAAKAVLADVAAPAVEPLPGSSAPWSVNRAGTARSPRWMELGVAARTIAKRHAATAAADAQGGRACPVTPRPADRRGEDSSSSDGSRGSSSGLSAGGGGGGGGCSNYGSVDGDGEEGKGNPLVAHLAAALTEVPPTTSAAVTRCRALACLADVRAAGPDGGIGLPPVPTTAEREALRIVLNRRSADRSRQRRRRQATAVAAAVADKEATIAALRKEVARLIAHVTALQRQLGAKQVEEGHPAEAA